MVNYTPPLNQHLPLLRWKHLGPFGRHGPSNSSRRMGMEDLALGESQLRNNRISNEPFLSQLHGAFLALLARVASCSGVKM